MNEGQAVYSERSRLTATGSDRPIVTISLLEAVHWIALVHTYFSLLQASPAALLRRPCGNSSDLYTRLGPRAAEGFGSSGPTRCPHLPPALRFAKLYVLY